MNSENKQENHSENKDNQNENNSQVLIFHSPEPSKKEGKNTPNPQGKKKKPLWRKIVSNLLYAVLLLFILLPSLWFFKAEGEGKPIFGYRVYYVMSPSMEPDLPTGSMIFTKLTEPYQLVRGDYITYSLPDNTKEYCTRQIIDILPNYNQSGNLAFQTKGINQQESDSEIVLSGTVVGKVTFCLPKVGYFFQWVTQRRYYFIAIFSLSYLLKWSIDLIKEKPPKKLP